MKTKLMLIVIISYLFSTSCIAKDDTNMNETLNTIFERKSVRNFIPDRQIPRETLELIVRAGMAAPTGRNIQPWEFIVLEDKEVMKKLAEALPYAKMLANASAAIIVCGYAEDSKHERASRLWMLDCSNASQNILLAVESLGLGAVWTAGWPYEERMNAIKAAVKMPDELLPLNVIPIGYPTGEDKPKDKFVPNRIHWNKFND